MSKQAFLAAVHENPLNSILLERLRRLGLKDCHLVAGCLFQAVWNRQAGWPADRGVSDYDVFYFDDSDLSWEAEDRVVRKVAAAAADLTISIDVKNQARVHQWYGEKFGPGYPQLKDARDGIGRYLVACTCVGLDVEDGTVVAPYGFDELNGGILRMNPANPRPALFRDKVESYRARWPWLTIEDCSNAVQSP